MGIIDKLSSMAYNQIVGGLLGFESTQNISTEELSDSIVMTRLFVLKKYALLNQLPLKDLYLSINCIPVDCKQLSKCCEALDSSIDPPIAHFEIPLLFLDAKEASIQYIGSVDKQLKFKVYTDPRVFKYHKYKTRGKNKPYVYIDPTPNENNHLDGYIFNAPLLETLSISAIFKDIRDLEEFLCCDYDIENLNNLSWIDTEVVDTVVKKYLQYYRLYYPQPLPNDQVAR